jgi:hypothetical protein
MRDRGHRQLPTYETDASSAPWIIAAVAAMAIVGGITYGMRGPSHSALGPATGVVMSQVVPSVRFSPAGPTATEPTTDGSAHASSSGGM